MNKLIETKKVEKSTSIIEKLNLKKDIFNNSTNETAYKIVEQYPEYLLLSQLTKL